MSDSAPLTHDELAEGLAAYMKHLARSGVMHLPRGEAANAADQLAELLPAAPAKQAAAGEPAPAVPDAAPTTTTPAPRTASGDASAASSAAPLPGVSVTGAASSAGLPRDQREQRLTQLAAQVADCVRCEALACARTQTVFGEGNPEARVCFFGEAPGADEDRMGRPFVGKAGQLLTKMIEACQFAREDVYILNTVKCRPPGNRNPEPTEIDNCREYFETQLELVQPEYIVCLGLVAAQSLLNSKLSVGKLRGRFHAYRNSKVLVTYHPAYLLRNPSAKRMAWQDLQIMLADMGIKV